MLAHLHTGTWIWFLGDDDVLDPSALPFLLPKLRGCTTATVILTPGDDRIQSLPVEISSALMQAKADYAEFANGLQYLSFFPFQSVGFISNILVRRSSWLESDYECRKPFFIYPQVGALVTALGSTGRLGVTYKRCIIQHSGDIQNDWYRPLSALAFFLELSIYRNKLRLLLAQPNSGPPPFPVSNYLMLRSAVRVGVEWRKFHGYFGLGWREDRSLRRYILLVGVLLGILISPFVRRHAGTCHN